MRATRISIVCTACAITAWTLGNVPRSGTPWLGQDGGGGVGLWLLYIGPDMLLPFTSAIGAVIGVLLMFWQRLLGWGRRLWRIVARRKD